MSKDPANPAAAPRGELAIRTVAQPADTNPAGDIFGGWLLSQMDIAGALGAAWRAKGRVTTVAVQAMKFHRPVSVGDVVNCYGEIIRVGRTSITVLVEVWVQRRIDESQLFKVTEGEFTYVAIDSQGRPRPV